MVSILVLRGRRSTNCRTTVITDWAVSQTVLWIWLTLSSIMVFVGSRLRVESIGAVGTASSCSCNNHNTSFPYSPPYFPSASESVTPGRARANLARTRIIISACNNYYSASALYTRWLWFGEYPVASRYRWRFTPYPVARSSKSAVFWSKELWHLRRGWLNCLQHLIFDGTGEIGMLHHNCIRIGVYEALVGSRATFNIKSLYFFIWQG